MNFYFVGERLAVDLLNTVIAPDGEVRDLLGTPGDVVAWAEAAEILRPRELTEYDPDLGAEPDGLRAFRERLRGGLTGWAETGSPARRFVGLLNDHFARDPDTLELRLADGDATLHRRQDAPPIARIYGAVARSAAELLTEGDPNRLRGCASPSCRLMFYDVSKAGRRRWCSMQLCGARAKVRAYRRRHASGS